ncbi:MULTISPECIES: 5-formyltetrahydrofolate cyclo-ligase [Rhodopseudomonas]|uniref:5-formyltetrahydrofolate cyclo-ligase n=1 Tax=Rhodopseudomonas palustris TaxID=1076 RepID=A0A0D7ENV5_RHOPL|nr:MULTISPECIES: 5-formyltetrahydrofolate cyclo-ligase [Rhodopseudomonas]KIZ42326.1 5-formyltetrahydrofolate cyclo-ligase [Rhodopseudomonas palustris]MDF3812529.1 5-formyltetrahydrofolate cyclo-ligase [Rhodopseudomonas sp. BAL398]WOK17359.1 5-formyltetrahydrofolate cyclo-ligase [Rhodopseudomonas sp. BAL398]
MSELAETPTKTELRAAALVRRDALDPARRADAATALAARALPCPVAGMVVSGYVAIRGELDPLPLLTSLAARGARLALPAVAGRDLPLQFRAWRPGDPLVAGQLGTSEPVPEAPEISPDILLVPLAAFDRLGHRIGYGAGHYDRSIAQLRQSRPVIAIGIAFAMQQIPAVPATAHDVRLDYVLTEADTFDFRSS